MKLNDLRYSILLCSLVAIAPVSAAVTLQATRIVHDAAKGRDATLRAANTGDQPALTQVWIDDGDGRARPEDIRTPFRLTPADPRLLQPHQGQAYRITYAPRPSDPALPRDRESVFYFNLLDIPPAPAGAEQANLLQFAVRTRIKLFHRPQGLAGKAEDAAASLRWSVGADRGTLRIHNASAFHVSLDHITLEDGTSPPVDMIAPFSTVDVPMHQPPRLPATVTYSWLDDYGAQREGRGPINAAPAP